MDKGRDARFTALLHHISHDLLAESFMELKRSAAVGINGITWRDYEENLDKKIVALWDAVQSGRYRAQPSRRVCIPKADGSRRPLGIAALEDKIVQQAVAMVLNAIYEADFLGFSLSEPARRAGRTLGRAYPSESELDSCRRHQVVFRHDRSRLDDAVS